MRTIMVGWPSVGQVTRFTPFRLDNGTEGFAISLLTAFTNQCQLLSIDLEGRATTPTLYPVSRYRMCTIIAVDSSSYYLTDDALNVMRYSFGANNWSWIAPSLFSGPNSYTIYSAPLTALVFNQRLYFQTTASFSTELYLTGTWLEMDVETGSYASFLFTPSSSQPVTVSAMVADQISFPNGSIIAFARRGSSDKGAYLFSALPSAATGSSTWLRQPISGQPYVDDGKLYFLAINTVYCIWVGNGSVVWFRNFPGVALDTKVTPIVAGGLLYVMGPSSPSTSTVVYVFDFLNRTPDFNITMPFFIPNCVNGSLNGPKVLVKDSYDPTSPWAYFAGGNGHCLVRFNAVGGVGTWEAVPSSHPVDNPPIVGKALVWFIDNTGYLYWQRKNAFTGNTMADRLQSPSPVCEGITTTYSPLTYHKDRLLLTCGDTIVGTNATTFVAQFNTTIPAVAAALPPLVFNSFVFVITLSGSFASWDAAGQMRFFLSPPVGWRNVTLGLPVMAPWGLFVFGNSNGILGVDWNGKVQFTITTDRSGTALSCSSPTAYRDGIAYVVCNNQLQLIDLLRGEIWLSSSSFFPSSPLQHVVVDTSSELSLGVITIYRTILTQGTLSNMLYEPNELPGNPQTTTSVPYSSSTDTPVPKPPPLFTLVFCAEIVDQALFSSKAFELQLLNLTGATTSELSLTVLGGNVLFSFIAGNVSDYNAAIRASAANPFFLAQLNVSKLFVVAEPASSTLLKPTKNDNSDVAAAAGVGAVGWALFFGAAMIAIGIKCMGKKGVKENPIPERGPLTLAPKVCTSASDEMTHQS